MKVESKQCVVLFADVTGSTRLYEQYGDKIAKENIDSCLALLKRITGEYNGLVIKTIGDEVMCTFPQVDYAYLASCSMHELILNHPGLSKLKMSLRIGFHFGDVIEDKKDVFGDTVNVAARIASLANATKTLVTDSVVEQLSAKFKNHIRAYDQVSLKGKALPVTTWEIIWKKTDDLTAMVTKSRQRKTNTLNLTLNYANKTYTIENNFLPVVVGRSEQATICVNGKSVSRTHLIIEYSRGNFSLTDKSTNGTYIEQLGGKVSFLKNEKALLFGEGRISLGETIGCDNSEMISYKLSY
mgnify:CR=1 FL=1